MEEPTRRVWSKPELTVLVRSGPEEAVLASCKGNGVGTPSAGTRFDGCWSFTGCTALCEAWAQS